MQRNYDKRYLELIGELLSPVKEISYSIIALHPLNSRIVDIGCGLGQDCRNLAMKLGPECSIWGLDMDQEFITEAEALTSNELFPNLAFIRGDAAQLPFESGSIDVVRFERVFQHLAQPHQVMAEGARVLKKGGLMLILETDYSSLTFGIDLVPEANLISTEKVGYDLRNGNAAGEIPSYDAHSALAVQSNSNIPVTVDSLDNAAYIFGFERNLARFEARNGFSLDFLRNKLLINESNRQFTCSWNTKIIELWKK